MRTFLQILRRRQKKQNVFRKSRQQPQLLRQRLQRRITVEAVAVEAAVPDRLPAETWWAEVDILHIHVREWRTSPVISERFDLSIQDHIKGNWLCRTDRNTYICSSRRNSHYGRLEQQCRKLGCYKPWKRISDKVYASQFNLCECRSESSKRTTDWICWFYRIFNRSTSTFPGGA